MSNTYANKTFTYETKVFETDVLKKDISQLQDWQKFGRRLKNWIDFKKKWIEWNGKYLRKKIEWKIAQKIVQ